MHGESQKNNSNMDEYLEDLISEELQYVCETEENIEEDIEESSNNEELIERAMEQFSMTAKIDSIASILNRYSDTSTLRKCSAVWVMVVVSVWLLVVLLILILCGASVITIQSGVLIALLGTTTANIIGLPLVLLKGLYPKEEEISKLNEEIAQFTNMRKKEPPAFSPTAPRFPPKAGGFSSTAPNFHPPRPHTF